MTYIHLRSNIYRVNIHACLIATWPWQAALHCNKVITLESVIVCLADNYASLRNIYVEGHPQV